MSARLASLLMAKSEVEYELARKRRAWWLFVARLSAGMNQAGVATALGLSENSASTVSDWERGTQDPSLKQLHDLAILYGVPLSLFTAPEPTDEEALEVITGRPSQRTISSERLATRRRAAG